jgi:hypothetical protein
MIQGALMVGGDVSAIFFVAIFFVVIFVSCVLIWLFAGNDKDEF